MIVVSAIVRAWRRLNNPVCQDLNATMYGKYKGHVVSLVPLMDERDKELVVDWVPDPDMVETIDAIVASEERSRQELERVPVLPTLPSTGNGNGSQGGFNPASCGL